MARVLQSLELFASNPAEAPRRIDSRPAPSKQQLWIAVCLPSLAFECLPAANARLPAVVVAPDRGQLHVVAASRAAAEAGIAPGTKLQTAMALAASLQVFERAPSREQEYLESLAEWAQKLTSMVSIEPPESLLLEVAGSLKLFGSLEVIKTKLRLELARRHGDFRFCAAPTATAALWLARAASADVLQWRGLTGSLAALPVSNRRLSRPRYRSDACITTSGATSTPTTVAAAVARSALPYPSPHATSSVLRPATMRRANA